MRQKFGLTRGLCGVVVVVMGVVMGGVCSSAWAMQNEPPEPGSEQKLREVAEKLANQWAHEDEEARWRAKIDANPNDAQAHLMLAYTVHTSGDLERAIELHKKAARFPLIRATAIYNIGCVHAMLGRPDEAFRALGRAVNLGQRNVAAIRIDTDLESLYADERWGALLKKIEVFNASPPETALHFWTGEWDCYGAVSGVLNGKNTLELRVKNNVIHESWTASDNTTGESWNYYNAARGTWRQIWVDDNGIALEMDADVTGEDRDGVLFEGDQIRKDGTTVRVRMHVRPVGEGWVRQTGTATTDGGETWEPRYDLVYVPVGEAFDPESLSEEEI